MKALLEVKDLTTQFTSGNNVGVAVEDVSFNLCRGRALGLVGESGSGKSVTAKSILRLIACPPGRITKGQVFFEGEDLLRLSESEMRGVRGAKISMIFQEPMTSLNPVLTVGLQITEVLETHSGMSRAEARKRAIELLAQVGLPSPADRIDDYPHQFSGGMRQRVMIAMALACEPALLIADEPTTALDVTIQAQIMDLLGRLRKEENLSILLITHDLGLVAQAVDELLVMYAGQVVERASVKELFASPLHPYTRALLESIPRLGGKKGRLPAIEGMVPGIYDRPSGCRFRTRCRQAFDPCEGPPPLFDVKGDRQVRCWKYEKGSPS